MNHVLNIPAGINHFVKAQGNAFRISPRLKFLASLKRGPRLEVKISEQRKVTVGDFAGKHTGLPVTKSIQSRHGAFLSEKAVCVEAADYQDGMPRHNAEVAA